MRYLCMLSRMMTIKKNTECWWGMVHSELPHTAGEQSRSGGQCGIVFEVAKLWTWSGPSGHSVISWEVCASCELEVLVPRGRWG